MKGSEDGNFIKNDEIRFLQWLALYIEEASAGGKTWYKVTIGNKVIKVDINVSVEDKEPSA